MQRPLFYLTNKHKECYNNDDQIAETCEAWNRERVLRLHFVVSRKRVQRPLFYLIFYCFIVIIVIRLQ